MKTPLFSSKREKNLWICVFVVTAAIFSTLFIESPLVNQLRNQNLQAVLFVLGMLLVGSTVISHGLVTKPGKIELSIVLGLFAVYFMLFVRLGAHERSHVIEYSVLAIFLHKAFIERAGKNGNILLPASLALIVGLSIGTVDEWIQKFLPNRVFDQQDILFNGLAVVMAIGSGILITWVRKRISKFKR